MLLIKYLFMKKSLEISGKDFEQEVLSSNLPVLVDFFAEWCAPCKMITPLVEEISKEYQGRLKVVKINIDSSPDIASKFLIMSIPTLLYFKDGKEVSRTVGAVSKKDILEEIKKIIQERG
jgi:thioredoxin 1